MGIRKSKKLTFYFFVSWVQSTQGFSATVGSPPKKKAKNKLMNDVFDIIMKCIYKKLIKF